MFVFNVFSRHALYFHEDKNSLSGQMHPDFGNLLNLTVLIASENKFTGVIPSSFGFLPQLENLDIGA